jgi:hypothetical protein
VINARFAMVIPVDARILGEILAQGDGEWPRLRRSVTLTDTK